MSKKLSENYLEYYRRFWYDSFREEEAKVLELKEELRLERARNAPCAQDDISSPEEDYNRTVAMLVVNNQALSEIVAELGLRAGAAEEALFRIEKTLNNTTISNYSKAVYSERFILFYKKAISGIKALDVE